METALHELLADLDEDHQRVSLVLRGERTAPPRDAALTGLAHELRRLRWMDPEASAMALLCEAAAAHADAVERHLAWLASAPAPAAEVVLADAAPVLLLRRAC